MAAGRIVVAPYYPAKNRDGNLVPGAKLFVRVNGTTTPASTFADEALTTPNLYRIVANSSGHFPAVWVEGGTPESPIPFEVQITDPFGASIGNPSHFTEFYASFDYGSAAVALSESAADAAQAALTEFLDTYLPVADQIAEAALLATGKTNLAQDNVALSLPLENPGSEADYGYYRHGASKPLPPNDDFSFSVFCDQKATFGWFRPMTSIGETSGAGNDATAVISGISYPIMRAVFTATEGQTVFSIPCQVSGVKPTPAVARVANGTVTVAHTAVLAGANMTVTLTVPATAGDIIEVFGIGFTPSGTVTSAAYSLPLYRGTNTQYESDKTSGPLYTLAYVAKSAQALFVTDDANNVQSVTVAGSPAAFTLFNDLKIQLTTPATTGQSVVIVGQNDSPMRKRVYTAGAGQTLFDVFPSANVDSVYVNNVGVAWSVVDADTIQLTTPATLGQTVEIQGIGLKSAIGVTDADPVATAVAVTDAYGKFTYPNATPLTQNVNYDPSYDTNRALYGTGAWQQNALKSPLFINVAQRRDSFYTTDRGDGIAAGLVFSDAVGMQMTGSMEGTSNGRLYGGHFNLTLQPGPALVPGGDPVLWPGAGAADGQAINLEMEMNNASYSPASDIFSYRQKVILQLVGVGGDTTKAISIQHDRGTGGIHTMLYVNDGTIKAAIPPEDQEPNLDSGYLNDQTLPYYFNEAGQYVDVGGSFLRYGDIYREAHINGYMVRANGHVSPRHSAQIVEHVLRPNGMVQNIWETNYTGEAENDIYQEYLFTGLFGKSMGVSALSREWRVSDDLTLDPEMTLLAAHDRYVNFLGDEEFCLGSVRRSLDRKQTIFRLRAFGDDGRSYMAFVDGGTSQFAYSLGIDNTEGDFRITAVEGLSATPRFSIKSNAVALHGLPDVSGGSNLLWTALGTAPSAIGSGAYIRADADGTLRYRVAGFPERTLSFT